MANKRLSYESRHLPQQIRGTRERRVSFVVPVLLREAVIRDDAKEVLALLGSRTMDIGLEDKNSALLLCCRHNSLRCARLLLERGAEVSCRDDDHWTPLHIASACGHTELVQLLLEFNADACTVDVDGNLAVDHAKDSSVTALLAGYMDHYGMHDPELQAARAHQAKTVMGHVLNAISRRRNLNELNENGVTLLHITAACGFYEAASLLLEHGAAVDIRDCHGLTPLHIAIKFNQLRMAKLLLNKGASSKAAPGVPLPSLANEILSEALSSPLPRHIRAMPPTEVNTGLYCQPQPCSSFWKLSDLAKFDAQKERRFLSRNWQPNSKVKRQQDKQQTVENKEELIYEDLSLPEPSSSAPYQLEELYDTAVVHESIGEGGARVIKGAWPPHQQQPNTSIIEEEYDSIDHILHKAEDDYDDVQNVLNGVEDFHHTIHDHTYVNVSPGPSTPGSDNGFSKKHHTYVNIPSNNSINDDIYDDCHTQPRPHPAPYEEVTPSNQLLGSMGGSCNEDYEDVEASVTSSAPASFTKGNSPQGQRRKMGRRRSRLPSCASTSDVNLPSHRPLLTKSYSDSCTSSSSQPPISPLPQMRHRPLPPTPPAFQTPPSWLSRMVPPKPVSPALTRRDSTPKQPPPPPPHSRRHCARSQSISDLPLSPTASVSHSPPSPSIPEEEVYSVPADPNPSLQAPPSYEAAVHNGLPHASRYLPPPKPLPKPRRR